MAHLRRSGYTISRLKIFSRLFEVFLLDPQQMASPEQMIKVQGLIRNWGDVDANLSGPMFNYYLLSKKSKPGQFDVNDVIKFFTFTLNENPINLEVS